MSIEHLAAHAIEHAGDALVLAVAHEVDEEDVVAEPAFRRPALDLGHLDVFVGQLAQDAVQGAGDVPRGRGRRTRSCRRRSAARPRGRARRSGSRWCARPGCRGPGSRRHRVRRREPCRSRRGAASPSTRPPAPRRRWTARPPARRRAGSARESAGIGRTACGCEVTIAHVSQRDPGRRDQEVAHRAARARPRCAARSRGSADRASC